MMPITLMCVAPGGGDSGLDDTYAVLLLDDACRQQLLALRAVVVATQAALTVAGQAATMLFDVELFDYRIRWLTDLPLPEGEGTALLNQDERAWYVTSALPTVTPEPWPTDSETLHLTPQGVFWTACRDGARQEWETAELLWALIENPNQLPSVRAPR